jgi:hypothetical protein
VTCLGIISVLYTQQTLGTLYKNLENEKASDDSCQIVKDLFDMSQKSLDQLGKTGVFPCVLLSIGSNKSSKLGTCSNDIDCSLTGKHDLYSSLKTVNLSGCLDSRHLRTVNEEWKKI